MRKFLLAGAAIVVGLGTVTAVQAGPLWHMKRDLAHCGFLAFVSNQTNCAENVITDEGRSNDDNEQEIEQENEAEVGYLHDFVQLNLGGNLVIEGDDNEQEIEQENEYENENNVGSYTPVQINVGLNVVEDGDDNEQEIEQSNSIKVSGYE